MGAQTTNPDIENLKTVIPYFLKHNKEHIKDIMKWLQKADGFELNEIVKDLRKVIQLSEEINKCFEATIKKLEAYQ